MNVHWTLMALPRLYAIADSSALKARGLTIREYAEGLAAAGVTLVQYRDKHAAPQTILRNAALIAEVFTASGAKLILNDRADLAALAGWDGVHVGQGDLSPEDARIVIGADKVIGVSTHTDAQVIAADASAADYVAIGPVFATGTKLDASPVVGLEGVRRARALTRKPLVAIGGITRDSARPVIEAGADSVAVIGGLLVPGGPVGEVAREFLELLR
jgi:thiamine-phosphate pyrophosphorylase